MSNLTDYLSNHHPTTLDQAFRQYQLCRANGVEPPPRVMEYMLRYLDSVAASRHKQRVGKTDETLEAYWLVQDLIADGLNQEQAIFETAVQTDKQFESFKRQYLRWKKTAGPEQGNASQNRGDSEQ